MADTQLIMLEGLPSTGKSTNSDFLRMQLERNGKKVKWIHEVSRPHPVLFFDEAGFTFGEYEKFLKSYPETAHILDNIAVFRKSTVGIDLHEIEWNYMDIIGESAYQALREFDMWNYPLDVYKKFALEKWEHFAEKALSGKGEIRIIDSAVFQFQIFAFLFKNRPYKELHDFVRQIFDIIEPMNPCMIYFYRENAEETIDYLEQNRGTQYLENMWERDKNQLYYHGKPQGAEGFRQFLRDYATSARLLFDSLDCRKMSVEISKSDWTSYENKMLSFLEIENIPSPKFLPLNGVYRNEELNYEITVDGLIITDPDGNKKKLTPKTANEFYAECLPMILRFENQGIVMTGLQINARWSTTGMIYRKT